MSYHFFAMFLGFVLDLLFGDPHWLPHPIRLIGNLIASLEKLNKRNCQTQKISARVCDGCGCYRMDNRCGRRYP